VAIPLAIGGWRRWTAGAPCLALLRVGAMAVEHSLGRPVKLVALGDILPSNLGWPGWAFASLDPLWRALEVVVVVGIAWSAWRFRTRPHQRSVVIGASLIVVGALPFIAYGSDIDYLGLGDRGNMISAVGAALVFAGLLSALPRRACAAAVIALAALWVPARLSQDGVWARTGRETRAALAYVERCVPPAHGSTPLVVGPWAIVHQGVEGLSTSGDVSDALQALRGDSRQPVKFVYSARELAELHGVDLRHAARAGSHCGS